MTKEDEKRFVKYTYSIHFLVESVVDEKIDATPIPGW